MSRFISTSSPLHSLPLGLLSLILLGAMVGQPSALVRAAEPAIHRLTQAAPRLAEVEVGQVPSLVRNRVLRYVAQETGTARPALTIVSAIAEVWSDGCLGIANPAENCAAVQTPGWHLAVSDGSITRIYRTNATAQAIREEVPVADTPELPRLTASSILDEITRTTQVPLEQLDIVAAASRTWDGCLGLPSLEQPMCTMIAIPGWRVVVKAPERVWIYHTDQDGTKIRLNQAASQQGPETLVPQLLGDTQLPGPEAGVLFTVVTSGGFTGQAERTVLFEDGRVVRYSDRGEAELVRSHSPQAVAAFSEQMRLAQPDRFQGLYYPAPSGAADYRTVTILPGSFGVLQYDDIVADQLPTQLQQVMEIWQAFSAPVSR